MNKIIDQDIDFILKSDVDWGEFKGKTVLVTGAYGTLMSYITYVLIRLKVKIIVLVRDRNKAGQRFGNYVDSKCLKIIEHDLSSQIEITDKIDYIFHGASYASPNYFKNNPTGVLLPNTIGTYHLLELAKKKKIKGFLFFSSGAVYGKNLTELVAEKDYGYLDPLDIISCYGESKRMGENMCRCWQEQFGIPVKIVRPAHVYGPTMDIQNDKRVVAEFINKILNGQGIVLRSDGLACRSFCYIADATVAYFKVLLGGKDGEAYNVGNDAVYMSIVKLAENIVSTFPEKHLKIIINKKENDIPIEENKMLMSSRKIEALGWKCSFSLPEGLRRTVESFQCKA
ncbi:MAG: NAD-dependent epimerase/dehydratase family protein [Candidatus Margulisiibacteriota bacterium]|nr:NAD-dependent epimerase/dehydratase family protein [Candidatus Margulisiibacteriota bacterium]